MRILAIGEGMAEFSRQGDLWAQAYGGDVLNTAIHLARLGHNVGFASALGGDRFSRNLRQAWSDEGLDLALLATDPERQCGIYFIATDVGGERSFTYWRDDSAARRMVPLLGSTLADAVHAADLVYFSLITLAILPDEDRAQLVQLLAAARATGTRIAFDSNYRPALWQDRQTAQRWHAAARAIADIGLPTLEDEVALGLADNARATAQAWKQSGCGEVVVKLGAVGCLLADGQSVVPPAIALVVDTSGAGDAFNAGYLAARLHAQPVALAAKAGNRLAGWVVGQRGAIPARSDGVYDQVSQGGNQ